MLAAAAAAVWHTPCRRLLLLTSLHHASLLSPTRCFSVGYTQPLRRCVRCMCVGLRPIKQMTEASQRAWQRQRSSTNARGRAAATVKRKRARGRSPSQARWLGRCSVRELLPEGTAAAAWPQAACLAVRALGRATQLKVTSSQGRRPAAAAAAALGRGGAVAHGAAQAWLLHTRGRRVAAKTHAHVLAWPLGAAALGCEAALAPFSRRAAYWAACSKFSTSSGTSAIMARFAKEG